MVTRLLCVKHAISHRHKRYLALLLLNEFTEKIFHLRIQDTFGHIDQLAQWKLI